MSNVVLAFLAAAALVTIGVLGVRIRRARREAQAAFTRGLLDMGARLDVLARELAEAVEQAREEGERARILASLAGALDLDEILMRCAEAAASLPGVAAAAVTGEVDGRPVVAAVGVDPATVGATVGPPGGNAVRAVGLSYHYRDVDGATGALLSAIAVPIESGLGRLGFITAFGREEEPPVAGAGFRTLEAIARHAEPAIERANARALRSTSATAALTGLGNREALHETLAIEAARAHRGGEKLALCVLDADDLAAANARVGQPAVDGILDQVAALLRETVRPGDRVYRCGGDAFAVVLQSAGRIEAEATFARVAASLGRLPHPLGLTPSLSTGIAELKADDDGVSLFERAERALRLSKAAGQGTAT